MKTRYSVRLFAVSFALFFVLGTAGFACAATVDRSALASFYCNRTGSFPGYVCKRNVLLIIADDVGVDQIPWYIDYYKGSPNPITVATDTAANPATTMETVQKLAQSGVTFLNAWSSPVCSPTRACLYTGNYSFRHGVYSPETLGAVLPITIEGTATTTIAKVLSASGYSNGLFGKWHLGDEIDGTVGPIDFGWDHFAGALGGGLTSYTGWEKVVADKDGTYTIENPREAYATTDNVTDAVAWITAQTEQTKPWMATVAFNAPHSPWAYPDATCVYNSRTIASRKAK